MGKVVKTIYFFKKSYKFHRFVCRNWITQLDNKTLYFYGFLKSTLINNGVTMERDKLHVG